MTHSVAVPMWLALAAAAALSWAFISLLLLPGARWFMRRRINRLTAALNARLHLQIPAIAMTRNGKLRADIERMTQDLAANFEVLIGAAPQQWHLMQPNWPSDRRDRRAAGL